MKFNILFLALVSLVLVTGLVSADAPNVYPDQITGNATSVAAGSSVQISFVLKNTYTQAVENVKITLPTTLQNVGSWNPSVKIGASTIQISNNQVAYSGKIDSATSSSVITLTFNVKASVSPDVYKGLISFQGTYDQTGSAVTIPPLSFSITIPPAPAMSFVQLTPALSNNVGSTKIALNNTGNTLLSTIVFNLTGNLNLTITASSIPTLAVGAISSPLSVTTDLTKFHFGDNIATITAQAADGTTATTGYTIRKSFCSNGQVGNGNLTISRVDITEYNDKPDVWKHGDKISIEVRVKSNVIGTVGDIAIEAGFFNSNNENVVTDLKFTNTGKEIFRIGDLSDKDEETETFTILVPADINNGEYKLAIKAYSRDEGEEKACVDTSSSFGSQSIYKTIKVDAEKDQGRFIAFQNMKFVPDRATCGDSVALSADVFNIGNRDQDRVRISLFNSELGVDQSFDINKLKKEAKEKKISFIFSVPKNVQDKTYNLELGADYDYDKVNDQYKHALDTTEKVSLKVIGCIPVVDTTGGKKADISATIDSEVVAGKNVVIKATVRNLGNVSTTYALGVKGIDSWATLNEPLGILQLAAGQSKDISITLVTKDNAKGEQSLIIQAVSADRTDSKTFTVTFPEVKSGLSGINLGGNTLLWIVGAVNVVLLILIVLVAIRISRR